MSSHRRERDREGEKKKDELNLYVIIFKGELLLPMPTMKLSVGKEDVHASRADRDAQGMGFLWRWESSRAITQSVIWAYAAEIHNFGKHTKRLYF